MLTLTKPKALIRIANVMLIVVYDINENPQNTPCSKQEQNFTKIFGNIEAQSYS